MAKEVTMFGDKAVRPVAGDGRINALLEKGCQFEGKLTFEGTVRINGKFSGEIVSDDTLVVGEGAEIDAKVQVGTVVINGSLTGSIKAKDRIEMHAPAIVKGDIAASVLSIEEGVVFEGNCLMDRKATVHALETVG